MQNNQPMNNQPMNNQPMTNQPMNNQPMNNQPMTNQPMANKPMTNSRMNGGNNLGDPADMGDMGDMEMQRESLMANYPEIYFKLQPYILLVCDQMDVYYGEGMPSQDMIERISDGIYDDVRRMNPDMDEYLRTQEMQQRGTAAGGRGAAARAAIGPYGYDYGDYNRYGYGPDMFRRDYRRRGLGRDIIDILLLSELFRRRRRPFYPY
jgi:SWI/SNF related-matrix-associated actin-dependent regulator of chromatin subfamily C